MRVLPFQGYAATGGMAITAEREWAREWECEPEWQCEPEWESAGGNGRRRLVDWRGRA